MYNNFRITQILYLLLYVEWRIVMIETSCCQCRQTGQVLSEKGLCWNCHSTKEKSRYRYMINSSTLLLILTILLCTFFLLNALPVVYLFHTFSERYGNNTNQYIRIGAIVLFFTIYLIIKICFCVNLWKSRYISVGSKYLNPASELLLFLIKLSLMLSYLHNTAEWELRLSPLTESLNKYTEDFINSKCLAFFIVFLFLFSIFRTFFCILAYWLNYYYNKHFKLFFENHPNRKRINNIAHWELFYKRHPEHLKKYDTLFVAAKVDSPLPNDAGALKQEIASYISDPEQYERYEHIFLSMDDNLSLSYSEIEIYYMYVKDKLAQWKEDNLPTEAYLNSTILDDFITKFNSIKERFHYCDIENRRYFELSNRFRNDFELPRKQITATRDQIKLAIEKLFTSSSMFNLEISCKKELNETISLLGAQAINLTDYFLQMDHEIIQFDNVLITNRGIFLIKLETFDISTPFELMIERDGTWYQKRLEQNTSTSFEFLDHTFASKNNKQHLKLERMLNELIDSPLDAYLELHLFIIITNENLMLKNRSTQTVIHTSEFLPLLRSYPICLSEEQMFYYQSLLESCQLSNCTFTIPNYRKQIIDQLDHMLSENIQLVQRNSELIHQTSVLASDYSTKRKLSFLPLISR